MIQTTLVYLLARVCGHCCARAVVHSSPDNSMRYVAAIAAARERSDHRSAVARPVERQEVEAAVEEDDKEEFHEIPQAGDFMPSPTSLVV